MMIIHFRFNQLSFLRIEAAVLVVAPTSNWVACPFTMLNKFVAAAFPKKFVHDDLDFC